MGIDMDSNLIRQSIRAAAQVGFSRSGGPGGQNVNKVNTKVTLHIRLAGLEGLSPAEAERLREVLGPRIRGVGKTVSQAGPDTAAVPDGPESPGVLIITSSEERSQRVNLERAYARAEALIFAAARLPKKRRPTKVSRAAKERRLQSKRANSERKRERGGDKKFLDDM
jgi:ribosome-associated protein